MASAIIGKAPVLRSMKNGHDQMNASTAPARKMTRRPNRSDSAAVSGSTGAETILPAITAQRTVLLGTCSVLVA